MTLSRTRDEKVIDSVTVSLVVSSSTLSLDEIQQRLGIPFDEQRQKGHTYGRSRTPWKENTCIIRERMNLDLDTNNTGDNWLITSLGALLSRVRESASDIRSLAQEGDVGILISVQARRQPAFFLTSTEVLQVADLGAWLEYDLILFSEDDSTKAKAQDP
jgi:hypothetical protein